jgi:hypothetical protein
VPSVRSPNPDRLLTLAAGAAAAIPIIVATLVALVEGWPLIGDEAVIAVRALDVLSTSPPLVGQYSVASGSAGTVTHSPGPMLYWLLALPAQIGAPAIVIVVGAVNTACVAGSVALARRIGGRGLMFAAALALVVTTGAVPP